MLEAPDQVRVFVETVVASDWWRAQGWPETVEVRVQHLRRRSTAWGGYSSLRGYFVSLPSWAWTPAYIAHELAHVARWHDAEDLSHGAGFETAVSLIAEALDGAVGECAWLAVEEHGRQLAFAV